MKHISMLLLSVLAAPAFADSVTNAILESAPSRRSSNSPAAQVSTREVGASSNKALVSGKSCQELKVNDQKSLPLKYIAGLIQEEPRKLNLSHNPRTGVLKIQSPDMIANCNSMIEWKVQQTSLNGNNAYTVEARFKNGEACANGQCNYQVAKVVEGSHSGWETMSFSPNLKGYKECLKKAGVVKEDKIETSAIYYAPVNETATDIKETGDILFVSEGPESSQIQALHDKFVIVNDCKHYEVLSPDQPKLLSAADEAKASRDREAQELRNCTVNEYHRVTDFLDNYNDDYGFLKEVRDRLIKEAAVKSSKAILEGKGTEEDMKVVADFNKYLVEPLVEEAKKLANEAENLSGEAKTTKLADLRKVISQLVAYGNSPYLQQAHTDKLMLIGKFDDAKKINNIRLTIKEFSALGTQDANGNVSVDVVESRIETNQQKFDETIEKAQESYAIRTGQDLNKVRGLYATIRSLRNDIQTWNRRHQEIVQEQYAKIQPGGYCYAYFRNTQKCIAEAMEVIQRSQLRTQNNTKIAMEAIAELEKRVAELKPLEEEGRRYLAAQGVEAPAAPSEEEAQASPQNRDNSTYNFNYPGSQQPPMQGYMPPFQSPGAYNPMMPYAQNPFMNQNPYMMGQQPQSPFMGQLGAWFGMGGNMGMQPGMGMSPMGGMNPYMGMTQPGMGQSYGFQYGMPGGGQMPGMMPGMYGQQGMMPGMYGQQPGMMPGMYGQPGMMLPPGQPGMYGTF